MSVDQHGTGGTPASPMRPQPAAPTVAPRRFGTVPMRATMQLRRIDPWTTLKVSGVLAAAGLVIWMVAVGVLYLVLGGMGVWSRLNSAFTDVVADADAGTLITGGEVFGYSLLFGVLASVLFTAFATVLAFIYNLVADLVGGIEVTFADRD